MRFLISILCLAMLAPFSATAQSGDARLDRLERDLQLLQKDIYRDGKTPAAYSPAGQAGSGNDMARMEVRFQQFEERISNLEGRLEQLEFENRKLRETVERFQKDVELRFSDAAAGGINVTGTDTPKEATTKPAPAKPETQTLKVPTDKTEDGRFDSARDHYNHAFRLLTQTQYDEAGNEFESFIKQNPDDPLIGNAYYWAGETYYVRQNFIQAADYFRQGFEALPDGPKAGDNLLKLAMALSAIDRDTEACVVLKQVIGKFGSNSISLKKKATEERNRIGCK